MEENEKLKIGINSENDVSQQNGNAEIKPKNKKLTIVLVSVIIVLLIAIGVCVGLWFAGDTTKIINNKEEVVKEEENTSKKLDETKPWVYDADYGKDKAVKKVESFSSDKDLTVPYININSEDANKANDEIKNIYEETYSKYGSAPSYTIIYSSNYEFYENDNILSIVLRVGDTVINGGAGTSKTYIYNFNLDTLKKATLKEMAILCGFNSELDVQNKVKEWEKRQNDLEKANPDKVAAQMTGVVDGQYFIDKDKKLKFIYMSLAAGNYYTPAVVEPNKEIEDFYDFDNDDNSATGSIQDFSIMKNAGFANTVYETEKKQGEKYYKVSFDSNCNPTIYIEDGGAQPYATYRKFYNIKSDVAAGTTYITFDFKILNETEDGGKGEIKYSNVADNTFISIKLNYPPTNEYVMLQKVTTSSTAYDDYNKAVNEIKSSMKDEKWLKEKEMAGGYEPYDKYSTIKSYFAKLNSVNNKPYYVVLSKVLDSSYLRIVSYDGKEVTVNGHCGADYGNVKIDINNNIVEVNATTFVAYYKIVDGRFELLEHADNTGDGIDEHRTKLEEKYRKSYNFVEITTELTAGNIDKYIK